MKTREDFKQVYLGTAQLLVQTHNRLGAYGGVNEEQQDVMDHFMADFNAAGFVYEIIRSGKGAGSRYGIFNREHAEDD